MGAGEVVVICTIAICFTLYKITQMVIREVNK